MYEPQHAVALSRNYPLSTLSRLDELFCSLDPRSLEQSPVAVQTQCALERQADTTRPSKEETTLSTMPLGLPLRRTPKFQHVLCTREIMPA